MTEPARPCKYCKTPITWIKEGERSLPLNEDGTLHKCIDGKNVPTGKYPKSQPAPSRQIGLLKEYDDKMATLILRDGKPHHYAMTSQIESEWKRAAYLIPPENHPDVWLDFPIDKASFILPGAKTVQNPAWAKELSDPTGGEIKKPFQPASTLPRDPEFGKKTAKEILQDNLDAKRVETEKADAALAQINKEANSGPTSNQTDSCTKSTGTPAQTTIAPVSEIAPPTPQDEYSCEMARFKTLLNSINRPGIPDLLMWLEGSDFYLAPSSTKYHDAREGGLLHHSLKVYDNLVELSSMYAVEIPSDTSLVIIALMHDLCKVNIYKRERKSLPRRDEKTGLLALDDWGKKIWDEQMVYTVDDPLPLGHGEKSVIMLQRFVQLSDTEIFAIRWHMMAYDDSRNSYAGNLAITNASDKYRIIPLFHMADLAASFLEMKPKEEVK